MAKLNDAVIVGGTIRRVEALTECGKALVKEISYKRYEVEPEPGVWQVVGFYHRGWFRWKFKPNSNEKAKIETVDYPEHWRLMQGFVRQQKTK